MIKWIYTTVRRYWRKLGIKLYGNFFSKLYHAKVAKAKANRILAAAISQKKKQGLKLYRKDGFEVWAHNERNAHRKIDNAKKQYKNSGTPKS